MYTTVSHQLCSYNSISKFTIDPILVETHIVSDSDPVFTFSGVGTAEGDATLGDVFDFPLRRGVERGRCGVP